MNNVQDTLKLKNHETFPLPQNRVFFWGKGLFFLEFFEPIKVYFKRLSRLLRRAISGKLNDEKFCFFIVPERFKKIFCYVHKILLKFKSSLQSGLFVLSRQINSSLETKRLQLDNLNLQNCDVFPNQHRNTHQTHI